MPPARTCRKNRFRSARCVGDLGKAFILSVIGIGTLLATVAVLTGNGWAQPLLDLFKDLK